MQQEYIIYLQGLLAKNNVTYEQITEFKKESKKHEEEEQNKLPYLTNIKNEELTKDEIERYSRQMLLREIAYDGQVKIKNAKVALVGCGGIGCPGGLYLAAAGVGTLGLFDSDRVELNNLHRQVAHKTSSIGVEKSISLQKSLLDVNPHIKINRYPFLTPQTISNLQQYDIIIDGSDNPKCRYLVNDYCRKAGKVLFSGACIGWQAQITAFNNAIACYRCLWGDDQVSAGGCSTRGVVGMVPGLVSLILGVQAIKYITSGKSGIFGTMLLYDGLLCTFRKTKLRQRKPDCLSCGTNKLDISSYDYSKYDGSCALAPPQVNSISWTQLVSKNIKPTSILDVRSSSMFGIVHLQGTTNIPLDDLKSLPKQKLTQSLSPLLSQSDQIFVMCRRGNDSRRATKILSQHGIKTTNVIGGIEQYGKQFHANIPSI